MRIITTPDGFVLACGNRVLARLGKKNFQEGQVVHYRIVILNLIAFQIMWSRISGDVWHKEKPGDRPARFNNRKRPEGWLPPTVRAKTDCVINWVNRLMRLCPIAAISIETVRFDTQKLQNPEISGIEYQQGTLFGYEVREYLLAKYGHECQYCHGKSKDPVLEIDHIIPKSRGGSDRVSNLTLACHTCNQDKGNKTAEEYGHPKVQAEAKKPLKDAAAVNGQLFWIYCYPCQRVLRHQRCSW